MGCDRLQNQFLTLIQQFQGKRKKDRATHSLLGYIKLLLVALLCFLIYLTASRNYPLEFILLSALVLALLAGLWLVHDRVRDRIAYADGMIGLCNQQLDRINGKWTGFTDIGAEFIDSEHPYSSDLDIVGSKSLFQFLNTTHTWHGRQAFANTLLQTNSYNRFTIQKRQEAITELSQDISFSQHIQYYFSKIGVDSSTPDLIAELGNKKTFIKSRLLKLCLTRIPVLTILLLAAAGIFRQEILIRAAGGLLLAQFLVYMIGNSFTKKYVRAVSSLSYKMSAYNQVIDLIIKKKFASSHLTAIQEQLSDRETSALQAMKELGIIADRVRIRHHSILHFILNTLMLWDFDCAVLYEAWKNKYADTAEKWFLSLGEFESMLCFSHLPNVCNHTCIPEISESMRLTAIKAGHPLIPNELRVNNDFTCNHHIFIISGSNMSGKTTFLRTVGINLVLALAGGFVCAKQMTCSRFDLITSMRIADDLNQGVSTFYAELKRIKLMMDTARQNEKLLFLIDEIFRGTNSADRLTGAKTILTKLEAFGVVGMISTHDLELCELADVHSRIKNYSFSEEYENDKIIFNYLLKPGKSQTTNAKFLMKMAGIT